MEINGVTTINEALAADHDLFVEYNSNKHQYGTNNEYQLSLSFLIFILLLLTCFFMSHFIHHKLKIQALPEAGVSICIGMIAGFIALLQSESPQSESPLSESSSLLVGFNPTIFFVALLPPIIFQSGYSMKRRFFFQNFASILTFAVVGTLVSTIVVGIVLYIFVELELVNIGLSFAECLTFGSLISATDPVSTLAVFQELRVDPMLFYLVFGESVLNDAVSIVLFDTFSKFIGYSHTTTTLMIAALDFVLIIVGSTATGICVGLVSALVFKHISFHSITMEVSICLMFAYCPFLISEALQMSGIVAVLFGAMTMKHYTHNNLTPHAQNTAIAVFAILAHLTETAVFLNLGLSVFALELDYYNVRLILWSFAICLVARVAQIYPLSSVLNRHREEKIKRNQQHMLCFSGLRGAIAFALALAFPGDHRHQIIATTMVIVMISVFIMGGGTNFMLKVLQIKRLSVEEEAELDHPRHLHKIRRMAALQFDAKYLMPFFTKSHSLIQAVGISSHTSSDYPSQDDREKMIKIELRDLDSSISQIIRTCVEDEAVVGDGEEHEIELVSRRLESEELEEPAISL